MNDKQREVNRIKEENIQKDIEKYGEEFFALEKKKGKFDFNKEQKEFVIRTYNNPLESGKSIAKRFGVSYPLITERLKKWGVKTKTPTELYTLYSEKNENFFESIDSEEKAYWLGFVFADGNIQYNYQNPANPRSKRSGLKISLQSGDSKHLEKFRDALGFKGYKIVVADQSEFSYAGRGLQYARFSIVSKKLVEDLMDKGMIPAHMVSEEESGRKEFMEFPSYDKVPKNLYKHFVRGFYDGDGSLTRAHRKGKTMDTTHYTVKIVGNRKICEWLKEYFTHETIDSNPSSKNVYNGNRGNYLWSYERGGNHNVYYHLTKLYEDATIFLDRKKNQADDFFTYYKDNNGTPYARPTSKRPKNIK